LSTLTGKVTNETVSWILNCNNIKAIWWAEPFQATGADQSEESGLFLRLGSHILLCFIKKHLNLQEQISLDKSFEGDFKMA